MLSKIATAALFVVTAGLTVGCQTSVYTEHYVGVYDVQRQTTQELYKVTIRGDAEWASRVDYASGWVPAAAADLLASKIEFDEKGDINITGDPTSDSLLPPTHHYFEMGPMGVTQAPEEGRFVIVMSSNPDHFFRKAATLTGFAQQQDDESTMQRSKLDLLRKISTARLSAKDSTLATYMEKADVQSNLGNDKQGAGDQGGGDNEGS